MPEQTFRFKQFSIQQDRCAMKVGTDGVLLGAWVNVPGGGRILDIGTGTGLIALMIAQRCNALIDAIEIDKDAAEQAAENFAASQWAERLNIHHIPLQQFQPEYLYDLIISNPPYFESAKGITETNRKLARNSAHLELDELLERSSSLIEPTGTLAIIIPAEEEKRSLAIAKENSLYPYCFMRVKGTPDSKVKRALIQFSRREQQIEMKELVIEKSRSVYTDDYKELTKEFYLGF